MTVRFMEIRTEYVAILFYIYIYIYIANSKHSNKTLTYGMIIATM